MRSIDARLNRIERAAGLDPDDEFAWIERLSDNDLSRLIHQLCTAVIDDPASRPEQIAEANVDRAKLECEVLEHLKFYQQPDIMKAVAANRAAGRTPQPWDRDWVGLAEDFGLIPATPNRQRVASLEIADRCARLMHAECDPCSVKQIQ
jgi:hypothetical protein